MSTSGNWTRENREASPVSGLTSYRIGTGSQKHNPCMNAGEESNIGVVPAKRPNKVSGGTDDGGGGGKTGD